MAQYPSTPTLSSPFSYSVHQSISHSRPPVNVLNDIGAQYAIRFASLSVPTQMSTSQSVNSPTPSRTLGWVFGICLHLVHFCLHFGHLPMEAQCDVPWEDMRDDPSFLTAWGCLVLVTAAVLGTYYLFGRYKICRIGNRRPYAANAMHVMWFPGELELTMFCIYSPAHALLWIMTTDVNWMWSMFVMVILSVQLRASTRRYQAVIKNQQIVTVIGT